MICVSGEHRAHLFVAIRAPLVLFYLRDLLESFLNTKARRGGGGGGYSCDGRKERLESGDLGPPRTPALPHRPIRTIIMSSFLRLAMLVSGVVLGPASEGGGVRLRMMPDSVLTGN